MASSPRRAGLVTAAAAAAFVPFVSEFRVARPERKLSDRWRRMPVEPAGDAALGLSFRPLQARALGLDPRAVLDELLRFSFGIIRLAAYWDKLEPAPGTFDPSWLDWQVDAAERAGKQVIICTGPVKAFGYPEFFVPAHHLPAPLPEGELVTPRTHGALLDAGTEFLTRVIDRYATRSHVIAWQVEHEAVDPLGVEHSWRLSAEFAAAEVAAARAADPSRPVLMNGFLPVTAPVAAAQWWRTRDQGDSLTIAQTLADIIGVDYYSRHAVTARNGRSLYLDGTASQLGPRRYKRMARRATADGKRFMITEIQAEPWEAVTVPPSPPGRGMYSCLPEHMIAAYNRCVRWSRRTPPGASAYLFWGAEYWSLRARQGDDSYLRAFSRILADASLHDPQDYRHVRELRYEDHAEEAMRTTTRPTRLPQSSGHGNHRSPGPDQAFRRRGSRQRAQLQGGAGIRHRFPRR